MHVLFSNTLALRFRKEVATFRSFAILSHKASELTKIAAIRLAGLEDSISVFGASVYCKISL